MAWCCWYMKACGTERQTRKYSRADKLLRHPPARQQESWKAAQKLIRTTTSINFDLATFTSHVSPNLTPPFETSPSRIPAAGPPKAPPAARESSPNQWEPAACAPAPSQQPQRRQPQSLPHPPAEAAAVPPPPPASGTTAAKSAQPAETSRAMTMRGNHHHNGRKIRTACGDACSSSTISGCSRITRNWHPYPAA